MRRTVSAEYDWYYLVLRAVDRLLLRLGTRFWLLLFWQDLAILDHSLFVTRSRALFLLRDLRIQQRLDC